MSKDISKEWDYRVVRRNQIGDEWLSIQEVYYDDETGEPMAHTTDLQLEADSITELRKQLQSMMWSLDKEIVDEIKSEVENVQLGRDGHGNNIYGSSDGKSIVREEV